MARLRFHALVLVLIAARVGHAQYAAQVMSDSPVAYWRFDDAFTTLVDVTGQHPGTYSGGYTQGQPGALFTDPSRSVDFAGGSVSVPHSAALEPAQLTLEAWINLSTNAPSTELRPLLWKKTSVANPVGCGLFLGTAFITPGPVLCFSCGNPTVAGFGMCGPPPAGHVWNHVVATYDGTNAAVYLNGQQASVLNTPGAPMTSGANLLIGTGGTATLLGRIDEVAVYDHALTPARVAAHYAAAVGTGERGLAVDSVDAIVRDGGQPGSPTLRVYVGPPTASGGNAVYAVVGVVPPAPVYAVNLVHNGGAPTFPMARVSASMNSDLQMETYGVANLDAGYYFIRIEADAGNQALAATSVSVSGVDLARPTTFGLLITPTAQFNGSLSFLRPVPTPAPPDLSLEYVLRGAGASAATFSPATPVPLAGFAGPAASIEGAQMNGLAQWNFGQSVIGIWTGLDIAGRIADAGELAALVGDGGSGGDAGAAADAGFDGGLPSDAGSFTDGGADAGMESDAGTGGGTGGGSAGSGGGIEPPRIFGTGCGCHSAADALGALVLTTWFRNRCRRRR